MAQSNIQYQGRLEGWGLFSLAGRKLGWQAKLTGFPAHRGTVGSLSEGLFLLAWERNIGLVCCQGNLS